MLIGALFVVTLSLMITAGILSYNKQITLVFLNDEYSTPQTSIVNITRDYSTQSPESSVRNDSEISENTITTVLLVTTSNETANQATEVTDNETNTSSPSTEIPFASAELNGYINNSVLNDRSHYGKLDVCHTSACERAGKLIKKSINVSVDPCDDFYEFACGGWDASHTIPEDKSRFGSFDEVDEKLRVSIKEELSRTKGETDSKVVVFASDLYKACIDEVVLESRGVSPLKSALNLIGGWPLTEKSEDFNENDYDWRDSLTKQLVYFGLNSIYSITIQPDANDTLVNRVYYDSAGFGLGRNQLVDRSSYPDIVNAYKKYILQSALLLGANNDSTTHKDIEDLLDFESKLANLSLPLEKKRDSSIWYNRMTFNAFNQLTDNIVDWLNLTNRIYSKLNSSITVRSDELVIIQDKEYYKGVTELIENTPKRVIANYLGWNTVTGFGSYTNKKFRKAVFEFNRVVSGVEKEMELWDSCVNYLSTTLQYAVSRLYVDKNFSQKDKQEASVMIKDIKDSFNQLIHESDWLDITTKNKSLIKLNAITENIGYPDWLLINEELDKYYNLTQEVDQNKSFETILYLQYNSVFREFKAIREAVNLTLSWPMPPAIVNAAYEPTQNSITIPAGILKPPFFDSQRPAYLNYGAIGLVVGHELTHGFDDQGSQYDPKGDLINWWSEKIHKRFEKKAECFIDEYSRIYDPEAKMNLNGKNTVGENIADNGGIREAFRAYKSYVERHGEPQRLPHVSQYSPEQLFFLSHGNVWCELIRPEALKQLIQYNPHSPAKYRVNVPVSNFKSFSDAYKCKPDSPMNRKDKCVLW